MSFKKYLKELSDYEMNDLIVFTKKEMAKQDKTVFDDDVYSAVARIFGDEYLSDNLEDLLNTLNVKNELTY